MASDVDGPSMVNDFSFNFSATVNEGLWGISSNNGKLMRHSEKMFPLSDQVFVEKDWTLL